LRGVNQIRSKPMRASLRREWAGQGVTGTTIVNSKGESYESRRPAGLGQHTRRNALAPAGYGSPDRALAGAAPCSEEQMEAVQARATISKSVANTDLFSGII